MGSQATTGDPVRFGLLPSPQHTTWPEMASLARSVDGLGYATLWCSDHLYAPYPWTTGPAYEAYAILSGWAAITSRVRLGAMVSAVGFRNPALLVKQVTTLDHVSNGRAILSIGAGWFEEEHRAFGFEFGEPGERVGRLGEALDIIRTMLDGGAASGNVHYRTDKVVNLPPPIQERLPLLVGGRGDRMLGLVARYADAWNIAGPIDDVRHRDEVLRRRCDEIGRDHTEIERTYHGGPVFIRSTVREAREVMERTFAVHGIEGVPLQNIGPPEQIVERLLPFARLGFRHMYFDAISPYDEESVERLQRDVRPMLEQEAR